MPRRFSRRRSIPRGGSYGSGSSGPSVAVLDLVNGGTFARAGTAYLWDQEAQTMTQVSSGTRRTKKRFVTSVANATSHDGNLTKAGGGTVTIYALGCDSDYLYGSDRTNGKLLYNSSDGVTWTLVNTQVTPTHGRMFSITLANGNERMIQRMSDGLMYWSDDRGVTWTVATLSGAATVTAAPFGGCGWVQTYSGAVVFGTYGAGAGNELWRSTDYGLIWTRVLNIAGSGVTHFHAGGEYADGKIVFNTGDGGSAQQMWISTDDGATWARHSGTQVSPDQQVVCYRKTSDNLLIAGSDGNLQIFQEDMTTQRVGGVINPHILMDEGNMYVFDILQFDGIWYACSRSDNGTPDARDAFILVSLDLTNWHVYHRSPHADHTGWWRFFSKVGGKIWLQGGDDTLDSYFYSIDPVQMSERTSLILEGAHTNLIAASTANLESIANWGTAGTKEQVTSPAILSHAIRAYRSGNDVYLSLSPGLTSVAGSVYYVVKAWIYAVAAKYMTFTFSSSSSLPQNLPPPPLGKWSLCRVLCPTNAGGTVFLALQAEEVTNDDDPTEFFLGAIDFYAVASAPDSEEWVPGGATSVADAFKWETTLPSHCTIIADLMVIPSHRGMAPSTNFPLFAVCPSAGEYLQVSYDTTDKKIKCDYATSDTPTGSPLESAAFSMYTRAHLRIALRVGETIQMSLRHARTDTEHVSGSLAITGDPLTGASEILMGDDGGVVTVPTNLLGMKVYDGILDDDTLAGLMEVA